MQKQRIQFYSSQRRRKYTQKIIINTIIRIPYSTMRKYFSRPHIYIAVAAVDIESLPIRTIKKPIFCFSCCSPISPTLYIKDNDITMCTVCGSCRRRRTIPMHDAKALVCRIFLPQTQCVIILCMWYYDMAWHGMAWHGRGVCVFTLLVVDYHCSFHQ